MHEAGIGLALGGGAARGLAHIGVLRELQAAGVAVTHVAGCSFGSVVGAAYVCGTLGELEDRIRTLGRAELVRYADATFSGGVLRGDALLDELRHLTRGLHFEDLAVPFAVVATDLESGAPVVLRTGSIAEAVRASVSVPGLFAPAVVGGRALVDGGLVELVPLSALRELRPPRVVAVDVSSQDDVWTRAATRARLSVGGVRSRWRRLSEAATDLVPGRVFTLLAAHARTGEQGWGLVRTVLTAFDITEARLQRGTSHFQADLVIRPDVRRFHGHQFDRAAEIIAAGRAAARQALPVITGTAAASDPVSRSGAVPVPRPAAGGGMAG
ncbi:patatin-like phospholipase family protein [Caldinitratiruptor microaerophilus]|uniref:Phospholipase n=1 Tax=Caldinitratiruptor microaerophilus TaxID=671077 RepID=A0AA35G5K2_9FIRM|nr:patatin-like phospholipase family protein [Caldinitratiruptor microaerophilus]BDG59566.1 phospholipase [Caldinitratiruptor microaerophilus]